MMLPRKWGYKFINGKIGTFLTNEINLFWCIIINLNTNKGICLLAYFKKKNIHFGGSEAIWNTLIN